MKKSITILVICLVSCFERQHAQDSTSLSLPASSYERMHQKTVSLKQNLEHQVGAYLRSLQKQEERLKKKIRRRGPFLADSLFTDLDNKYEELKNHQGQLGLKDAVYSGHLDSLRTALVFFKSFHHDSCSYLLLNSYDQLQQKFNRSGSIVAELKSRQEELLQALKPLGLVKELKRYQKRVFYFEQQIGSLVNKFGNPSKIERNLLELAMSMDGFKDFFSRQSLLASYFSIPSSTGKSISLYGLQTRTMVNQVMIERLGSYPSSIQLLQQGMQSAQEQLNALKIQFMPGMVNSNEEMPAFKPDQQKTRSFFQRLELGASLQTERARYYFPLTTDIGLSMGYRLNDRSVIGIGVCYKLGLGRGWDHMILTHHGMGLRSYLDWKLSSKNTGILITGGYEYNYRSLIPLVEEFKNFRAWQSSGLLGLSKKYLISPPGNKKHEFKGDIKILWDFLSFHQKPRTQPFIIRMGYYLN